MSLIHAIGVMLLFICGGLWAFFWFTLSVFSADYGIQRSTYVLWVVAAMGPVAIAYGVWMLI
jgi:hypothetical protein